jgi:hypothetical protein
MQNLKLFFTDEDIAEIKRLCELLKDVEVSPDDLPQTYENGCGGRCMSTCVATCSHLC